ALLKTYKSRSKKRKQSFNPKTAETNEASFSAQEARKRRRQEKIDALEVASAAEGLLYGPGIDDSMIGLELSRTPHDTVEKSGFLKVAV
ncbi:hypothetical protein X777_09598, partial [Ooceraea biroi]